MVVLSRTKYIKTGKELCKIIVYDLMFLKHLNKVNQTYSRPLFDIQNNKAASGVIFTFRSAAVYC